MFDSIHWVFDYISFMSVYFTWALIAFIFVISVRDRLTEGTVSYVLGKWLLAVPFIVLLDYPFNVMISLLFWDVPKTRTELFTGRMKRYKLLNTEESDMNLFRYETAHIICPLLNKFDKGHC